MPIVRVYRCDCGQPSCKASAESADAIPEGWLEVRINEAGTAVLVFAGREHAAAWLGVSSAPEITEARARAVLAARQPFNPRAQRGLPDRPGPTGPPTPPGKA